MTIPEFFGTLQQSVVIAWRDHLKTDKYSKHIALNEFYDEMPELVDALIEAWQSSHDVVEDYKNILEEGLGTVEYLQALKNLCDEGRELMERDKALDSLIDNIVAQIDSTLYKITKLTESHKSLSDFLKESLD